MRLVRCALAFVACFVFTAVQTTPAAAQGTFPPEFVDRPVFLVSRWTNDKIAASGQATLTPGAEAFRENVWTFEPVAGEPGLYRIRSLASGGYLHIENGAPQIGAIQQNWASAKWRPERHDEFFRLQSVWKPDEFINHEKGGLESSPVHANFHSSYWRIQPAPSPDQLTSLSPQQPSETGDAQYRQFLAQVRQATGPLTGVWRLVQSNAHNCPDCQLFVYGSTASGSPALAFISETCLIGEARVDSAFASVELGFVRYVAPHPWAGRGGYFTILSNGEQLSYTFTPQTDTQEFSQVREAYVRVARLEDMTDDQLWQFFERNQGIGCKAPSPQQLSASPGTTIQPGTQPPVPQTQQQGNDGPSGAEIVGQILQFGLGVLQQHAQQPSPPQPQPVQPRPAQPQAGFVQPSFPCSGSRLNTAERMICSNAQLATLDNQMVALYRQVRSGFDAQNRSLLKSQQTRWLRERNNCTNEIGCIANAYNMRIAALSQMASGSAGAGVETVRYICEGGFTITARYDNRGNTSIVYLINPQGQEMRLDEAQSGSGVRYAAGNVEWHTKNNIAVITQGGQSANCREQ